MILSDSYLLLACVFSEIMPGPELYAIGANCTAVHWVKLFLSECLLFRSCAYVG